MQRDTIFDGSWRFCWSHKMAYIHLLTLPFTHLQQRNTAGGIILTERNHLIWLLDLGSMAGHRPILPTTTTTQKRKRKDNWLWAVLRKFMTRCHPQNLNTGLEYSSLGKTIFWLQPVHLVWALHRKNTTTGRRFSPSYLTHWKLFSLFCQAHVKAKLIKQTFLFGINVLKKEQSPTMNIEKTGKKWRLKECQETVLKLNETLHGFELVKKTTVQHFLKRNDASF